MKFVLLIFLSLVFSEMSFAGKLEVIGVVDGDTLIVKDGNTIEYYALFGVDAPELGQKYSEESKAFLEDLFSAVNYSVKENKTSEAIINSVEIYFVNDVNGGQQDLSCWLIIEGLAFYDRRIKKNSEKYIASEEIAKKTKSGVWSQERVEYPWAYRSKHNIIEEESIQANRKKEEYNQMMARYAANRSAKGLVDGYADYDECYEDEMRSMKSQRIEYPSLYIMANNLAVRTCAQKFGMKVKSKQIRGGGGGSTSTTNNSTSCSSDYN